MLLQLHCLVGRYAMSAGFFGYVENKFPRRVNKTAECDFKLFAKLNVAIIYLSIERNQDLK